VTTIATWNVNGIRARQEQVLDWIARERPGIFCLQELKAAPEQVPEALRQLEDYWTFWHGAGGYSGVGLGIHKSLAAEPPEFHHPRFDHETRIVTARLGSMGELEVASVYVPNGGKDYAAKLAFLRELREWAAEARRENRPLLIAGDLNVAREERDIHPKERKPGQIGARPEERELLAAVVGEGLADVGRALDPENDALFTWWAPWRNLRQRNIGWRIDYLLLAQSHLPRVRAAKVEREVGTSDHAPVTIELAEAP